MFCEWQRRFRSFEFKIKREREVKRTTRLKTVAFYLIWFLVKPFLFLLK